MNLGLLETFGQKFPEEFNGILDSSMYSLTLSFNPRGTLLAVGGNDGKVQIWDFVTRGISRVLPAHLHPISSLCWSRDGHEIVTSSTDNTVSVWRVETGLCSHRFVFPSPVLKAVFHPRNSKKILVTPMKYAAILLDIPENTSSDNGSHPPMELIPLDDPTEPSVIASFDRKGEYIYTGNQKGKILVHQTKDLKLATSFRVHNQSSSVSAIRSIDFPRKGSNVLINTADRVLRVYDTKIIMSSPADSVPEPIQKLQDLVNKMLWKKCCFSGDGEYICAGPIRAHSVYVWEISTGTLVKILSGTKGDIIADCVWHPVRPVIASISSGVVSVWAQSQVENWSAFAPDFEELEENVDYEERESEFDKMDEDKSLEMLSEHDSEEIDVDVTTVEKIPAFCGSSDDELPEEEQLIHLPVGEITEDPPEPPFGGSSIHSLYRDRDTEKTDEPKRTTPTVLDDGTKVDPMKSCRIHDIQLANAPMQEVHPLLVGMKKQEKQAPVVSKRPQRDTKNKRKERK